jgi:hypothetical protein
LRSDRRSWELCTKRYRTVGTPSLHHVASATAPNSCGLKWQVHDYLYSYCGVSASSCSSAFSVEWHFGLTQTNGFQQQNSGNCMSKVPKGSPYCPIPVHLVAVNEEDTITCSYWMKSRQRLGWQVQTSSSEKLPPIPCLNCQNLKRPLLLGVLLGVDEGALSTCTCTLLVQRGQESLYPS